MLSRRDALTAAEREAASLVIGTRTSALLAAQLPAGSVLALYAAKGSEVDTSGLDGLARSAGLRVVYPRIVSGDRVLAFGEAAPADLAPARFGIREPRVEAPRIELAQIRAFVVPGLAFDRDGRRIGWGRGHYDTTLAAAPAAIRIGIGFACQLIERVPSEAHDELLHYIITDVATYPVA